LFSSAKSFSKFCPLELFLKILMPNLNRAAKQLKNVSVVGIRLNGVGSAWPFLI
jgi:hypothetical protein